MFFFFSKILSFFFQPLSWIIIFLLLALFLKDKKKKLYMLIISFAMLFLFSNNFIFDEFMRRWEIDMNIAQKKYDIGIVLGGGIATYDKQYDRYIFRHNTDRLWQAIELYKTKKIKKILISGGAGNLIYRDYNEAEIIEGFLIRIGIPKKDIIIENKSDNTYQNALFCAEIINKMSHSPKCLLITSAYHIRRANDCFLKQGVKADIYPVDKYVGNVRNTRLNHIIVPNIKTLSNWSLLFHEWIGYSIYFLFGYL